MLRRIALLTFAGALLAAPAFAAIPSYVDQVKTGEVPTDNPKVEAGTCALQTLYMAFVFDSSEDASQEGKDSTMGYAAYWIGKAAEQHGVTSKDYMSDDTVLADMTAMTKVDSDTQLKVVQACLERIPE